MRSDGRCCCWPSFWDSQNYAICFFGSSCALVILLMSLRLLIHSLFFTKHRDSEHVWQNSYMKHYEHGQIQYMSYTLFLVFHRKLHDMLAGRFHLALLSLWLMALASQVWCLMTVRGLRLDTSVKHLQYNKVWRNAAASVWRNFHWDMTSHALWTVCR